MLTDEQLAVLKVLRTSLGIAENTDASLVAYATSPDSNAALDAHLIAAYIVRNGILPTVYGNLVR